MNATNVPERIETAVTRLLGIRYPILVAPMFLVSTSSLLQAAARAGGLGAIPALNFRTTAEYRAFLDAFPRELPFGVNLILKWGDRLGEDLAATVARKVPLVITSLGDPSEVVKAVRDYGGHVFCDVVSRRHAEKAVRAGASALIAVASGAGGHAGTVSPLVLAPWLKDALGVPVVLAGALSNGRQLAAALALGADAGYFGTRFIATPESAAEPAYRQALVDADPEAIEYTDEVTGVRGNFLRQSLELLRQGGDVKAWKGVWSAGQGVAFIDGVVPTAELFRQIVSEYVAAKAALP